MNVRTIAAVAVVAVVVVALAVCTSFAFKKGGKGTAPSDLQDRANMVSIDPGSFEMGSKIAEPDEFPQHKVTLSGFMIDKHEVTLGDYALCVEARVCKALPPNGETWETTANHPVVGVTWYDAKRYCEWVGKRLPTEAEWEFAARRSNANVYPWSGPFKANLANSRTEADGFAHTAPVGSFAGGNTPNGVQDMAGNASEWVADWYESTWYQKTNDRDPTGPEAPTGAKGVRGGSWSDPDHLLRSTCRLGVDPNISNTAIGFRCAGNTK
jgi:formylglycine-generating enzyme required for sulfatase activity